MFKSIIPLWLAVLALLDTTNAWQSFLGVPGPKSDLEDRQNGQMRGRAASTTNSFSQPELKVANGAHESYDEGLFTPMEDLSLLSESEFTVLGHPAFPRYSVRIKKTNFCDGTVKFVAYNVKPRCSNEPFSRQHLYWIYRHRGKTSVFLLFREQEQSG